MNRGGTSLAVVACLAVAAGIAGIGQTMAQQASGEQEQTRQTMTTTYEIGLLSAGTFTPLATLSFDAENTGSLVLGAPHPQTPDLVRVWADLSKRDRVRIEETVYGKGAEDNTVSLMSVEVRKSDPRYPEALLRYMAHEYGFDSRPRE